MLENHFAAETLDAARDLEADGKPVTREAIARIFGITREAGAFRLRRLYELGLLTRARPRPARNGVKDSEAMARIEAVRAVAREKGRPLSHEELVQALGD